MLTHTFKDFRCVLTVTTAYPVLVMWLQGMARVKGKRLPAEKQKYRRHAGMPLPAECSSPKDVYSAAVYRYGSLSVF